MLDALKHRLLSEATTTHYQQYTTATTHKQKKNTIHAHIVSMPPLTLEQVLARSMRLPRQRTQRYVSKLYRGNAPPSAAALDATRAGALASELTEPGLFHTTHSDALATATASGTAKSTRASPRQEKLNFFELMEREEAARQAGRLSIHRSDRLVRNSADLTTFLQAAQRTGDWEDGLKAFAEATALPAFQSLVQEYLSSSPSGRDAPARGSPSAAAPSSASSVSLSGVNPNVAQVQALMDTCAAADQYTLVEKIGAFFAPAFPDAFAHAVELLVARAPLASSSSSSCSAAAAAGWRAGFAYVTERCPLPAAEVPVEAFNVCLRGCEAAKDWRGALEVIRAMGPNPLQGWTAAEEREASASRVGSSADSTAAEATPVKEDSPASTASPVSVSTPPVPNVVSYATLIATLEQAGKDQIASEVLNRLPAVEKEEITASYAALIFVWSNQVLHKRRRRF